MKPLLLVVCLLTLDILPVTTPAQKISPLLESLSFLSGRWIADDPDGFQEEAWSPIVGASMVGTFRVIKHGDAVFYEFWAIEIEDGKAVFKMKHFDRGLVGWEDKAEMVRLNTTAGVDRDVLFSKPDGSLTLRYQLKGDELISTLHHMKDGKVSEEVFHLKRSK